MEGYCYLKITLKYVATVLLIFTIFARFADAKGRARLSYSVAEAVCTSTAAFSRSSKIQPPCKSPIVNDEICRTLTWSNCETRADAAACQKFKLKNCPAQSQSEPYRSKERKTSRIINGTEAKPHEFPHIVRITRNDKAHCAGTIFNENYIVTAAHCFFDDWGNGTNTTFKVIAGDHNTKIDEGTEQIRTVANAKWHENFIPTAAASFPHDIAILLLDKPLEFSENVVPPDIRNFPDYDIGEVVTVAGWGIRFFNESENFLPDILQKADMSWGACGFWFRVNESNVICVDSRGAGQTSCGGDSGGPLTKKLDNGHHLFLGIVSFGHGCSAGFSNIYTKVSSYLDWINTNTEDC